MSFQTFRRALEAGLIGLGVSCLVWSGSAYARSARFQHEQAQVREKSRDIFSAERVPRTNVCGETNAGVADSDLRLNDQNPDLSIAFIRETAEVVHIDLPGIPG